MTTSSREKVRVVRNPLNVMAQLSEVVGGNGTRGGVRGTRARFEGLFACQWSEPRELCQKRRPWGIGVSRLKQDVPEMRPDVSLVILALRGTFGAPYWAPFGASVTQ
ncbi:hypothetical protein CRG98_013467 [Punica granatum]|uniref:Uncharacterized protein n=1 Tax=Punica granatum TaxID=22663 RepID=A0A2I0KC93_PUNGR|nr:hypothetical protein CRG98_013467 [Punica granatum]